MRQLLQDLYQLSDNAPLFDHLRAGGDPAALENRPAEFTPSGPKSVRADLLRALREALVPALQSGDYAGLDELAGAADLNARVIILGELVLALYALTEGRHPRERVDKTLNRAFRLARDLATAFEAAQPQDTDDEPLLTHGVALREWAHLLAEYCRTEDPRAAAEMFLARARVTNSTLSAWPHLVGAAMVELALAAEPVGRTDMAVNCCGGVRMDLHYLVDRVDDPALPECEKVAALYWLQRACEEFCRLAPADRDATAQLERVRALRGERNYPDAASGPRFGPIARTYLAETPYLALLLGDLEAGGGDVPAVCQRYGCPSRDVEFYSSAMGSYVLRDTVLRGVQAHYDEAHRAVFAAMDYLRAQGRGLTSGRTEPGAAPDRGGTR